MLELNTPQKLWGIAIQLADTIDNSEETTGFERRMASVMRQQAAEIERLKAEAELFAKHVGLKLAHKDAEIEHLTAELGDLPQAQAEMLTEIKALRANNRDLLDQRYALMQVEPMTTAPPIRDEESGHCSPQCPHLMKWTHPFWCNTAWCDLQMRDLSFYDGYLADCIDNKPHPLLTSARDKLRFNVGGEAHAPRNEL